MTPFIKMNGAGNDFVIFDARVRELKLTPAELRRIADRNNPVTKGCDQIIVMELSTKADVFMRIYNADSSEVDACGNATRCVADLLEKELDRLPITIQTNVAILKAIKTSGAKYISVDMGKPKLDWKDVPLNFSIEKSSELVKQRSELDVEPSFISMGNPHVVFLKQTSGNDKPIVREDKFRLIGNTLEKYTDVFPEGVNVSVVTWPLNKNYVNAMVWERGVGSTKSCGTAACAILVAANKLCQTFRKVDVSFGESSLFLSVELDDNGHVLLGGPVEYEFEGQLELKSVA